MRMTSLPQLLATVRELDERASKGPWDDEPAGPDWLLNVEASADFCRKARILLPLLAEIARVMDDGLAKIEGHAQRNTNNKREYERDTYGHIAAGTSRQFRNRRRPDPTGDMPQMWVGRDRRRIGRHVSGLQCMRLPPS